MRTIRVKAIVDLEIEIEEDAWLSDILNNLEYDFSDTTGDAKVINYGIVDFEEIPTETKGK